MGHVEQFPKAPGFTPEDAREEEKEEKEKEKEGAGVATKPIARWPEEHPSGSRGLWR